MKEVNVIEYYDTLLAEGDDPVYDSKMLQDYMNNWDGETFLQLLNLTGTESVLEIGVGTGRLAVRTAPACSKFTGIEIAPDTAKKAKENLSSLKNTDIICGSFPEHPISQTFDVIYSSLTFMHIQDKEAAIRRIAELLNPGGRFVLSIDKNISEFAVCNGRRVRIWSDSWRKTAVLIRRYLKLEKIEEIPFARIFCAHKK